jgi:hypothetical protein
MGDVLQLFRDKEPALNQVPDGQLALFIGEKHPEFLQDTEFAEVHGDSRI